MGTLVRVGGGCSCRSLPHGFSHAYRIGYIHVLQMHPFLNVLRRGGEEENEPPSYYCPERRHRTLNPLYLSLILAELT